MTKTNVLFALMFLTSSMRAQISSKVSGSALKSAVAYVPLSLFTNGPGRIVPFHDGEMLAVGLTYHMTAIPAPRYAFVGWNTVNVFNIIEFVDDGSGNVVPVTNVVLSAIPATNRARILEFKIQAPEVLFNDPGVRTIIESRGWQANFVRIDRWGNREPEP